MLINLTPHPINIVKDGEIVKTIPSNGIARLSQSLTQIGTYEDIPLFKITFGNGENIPEPDGNLYIVSSIVKSAYPDRDDLVVPAELVRDDNGNIIGCKGFSV